MPSCIHFGNQVALQKYPSPTVNLCQILWCTTNVFTLPATCQLSFSLDSAHILLSYKFGSGLSFVFLACSVFWSRVRVRFRVRIGLKFLLPALFPCSFVVVAFSSSSAAFSCHVFPAHLTCSVFFLTLIYCFSLCCFSSIRSYSSLCFTFLIVPISY